MFWWPALANVRGYLSATFKVKDGVFTLLHNNNTGLPYGFASTITPVEKPITAENVTFQLASAPKEDTGSLTYHHFIIRAI